MSSKLFLGNKSHATTRGLGRYYHPKRSMEINRGRARRMELNAVVEELEFELGLPSELKLPTSVFNCQAFLILDVTGRPLCLTEVRRWYYLPSCPAINLLVNDVVGARHALDLVLERTRHRGENLKCRVNSPVPDFPVSGGRTGRIGNR